MYDGGGFVSGWRKDRGVLVTRDTRLREILSGPGNVPPGTLLYRGVCREGMGGRWVQFFANILCWRWRRGMNGMSIVAISITRQLGATTVCENQLVGVDASDGAHHLIGVDQNSTSIWNVLVEL